MDPHGLWHKSQYYQFRFNSPARPGISLQRLSHFAGLEFLCDVGLPRCHNGAVIFCSHDVSIRGCLIQISITVVFIRIACHTQQAGVLYSTLFF